MFARKKGFTLIELLIVIAIILILIAIALPNFLEAQIRARVTKANGEMRSIATALFSYNTALINSSKEGIFPPAGNVMQNNWEPWVNSAVAAGDSVNGPNNWVHACSVIWVPGSFYAEANLDSAVGAAVPPTEARHYDLRVMTSPIEALTSIPTDPFKNEGGFNSQYDYFGLHLRDSFVIRSLGPDGRSAIGCGAEGFNCQCDRAANNCLAGPNTGKGTPGLSQTGVFTGDFRTLTGFKCDGQANEIGRLSEALRYCGATYAPTNGTKSEGDLFRAQQ